MRNLSLVLALLLSGCATPLSLAGPTTSSRADAYACALERLEALGYEVESAPGEGRARGAKQLIGEGPSIEAGRRVFSQLEVTVTGVEAATIRVVPTRIRETGVMTPFGWGTQVGPPEDQGIADGNQLLRGCGVPESAIAAPR
jgi:hypothetical protein